MACIKTGAQVYLVEHGVYAICDIHQFANGMWVLRMNPDVSSQPIREELHARIEKVTQDWSGTTNTSVVEYCDYKYYGYDGVTTW